MEARNQLNQSEVVTLNEEQSEDKPLLRLHLEPKKHIKWADDVVDNEFMDKKSSKRCCIYHKKRQFGESSSSSSDDEISDDKITHKKSYPDYQTYHA